ncbi:MAG: hypothetical protein ABIP39_05305, partial [Polyangiaceae bacterium]
MVIERVAEVGAVLGLSVALLACGSPTIQPGNADGGGGSFVTPPPGTAGVDAGTPEMPGVAPSCTNVD